VGAAILFFGRSKKAVIGVSAFVFIVLLIFISQLDNDKFQQIVNFNERSSLASRIMIWRASGKMIADNSIVGIGPGNFQNKYLSYQKYYPPYLEWAVFHPHNIFLSFYLQGGILGFVGFILLLLFFFRDNKKAADADCFESLLILSFMVAILVHGVFDSTYWRNDLAIIFWFFVFSNLFFSMNQPFCIREA
jgi:O-antigen ligase